MLWEGKLLPSVPTTACFEPNSTEACVAIGLFGTFYTTSFGIWLGSPSRLSHPITEVAPNPYCYSWTGKLIEGIGMYVMRFIVVPPAEAERKLTQKHLDNFGPQREGVATLSLCIHTGHSGSTPSHLAWIFGLLGRSETLNIIDEATVVLLRVWWPRMMIQVHPQSCRELSTSRWRKAIGRERKRNQESYFER